MKVEMIVKELQEKVDKLAKRVEELEGMMFEGVDDVEADLGKYEQAQAEFGVDVDL